MKKLTALILTLAVLCSVSCALALPEFKLDLYDQHPNTYTCEIDGENDLAFIDTLCTVPSLAFCHTYESAYTYSYAYTDVVVTDYASEERWPILRTWIKISMDRPMHFTSADLIVNGNTYTFTEISDEDRVVQNENDWSETLLIKYGSNNEDFINAISLDAVLYAFNLDPEGGDSAMDLPELRLVLHGDEDIEAVLPDMFWNDFGMQYIALTAGDYEDYISEYTGTPCEVR